MSSKIETQQENIKRLLELINSNPDLPIMPMVNSEIVADDGYNWWAGGWGSASIEDVWSDDERIYIRSEDEETLIEYVWDDMDDNDILSDDQLYDLAKEKVNQYNWKTVIAVRITLP